MPPGQLVANEGTKTIQSRDPQAFRCMRIGAGDHPRVLTLAPADENETRAWICYSTPRVPSSIILLTLSISARVPGSHLNHQ